MENKKVSEQIRDDIQPKEELEKEGDQQQLGHSIIIEEFEKLVFGCESMSLLPIDFTSACKKPDLEKLKGYLHCILRPVASSFIVIENILHEFYLKSKPMTLHDILKQAYLSNGITLSSLHLRFIINLDQRLYKITTDTEGIIMFEPNFCYQDYRLKWYGFLRRYILFARLYYLPKLNPPLNKILTVTTEKDWLDHFSITKLEWPMVISTQVEKIFESISFWLSADQSLVFNRTKIVPIITFDDNQIQQKNSSCDNAQEKIDVHMDFETNPNRSSLTPAEKHKIREIKKREASNTAKDKKRQELIESGQYRGRGRPSKNDKHN